jgi:hypothetical protein
MLESQFDESYGIQQIAVQGAICELFLTSVIFSWSWSERNLKLFLCYILSKILEVK